MEFSRIIKTRAFRDFAVTLFLMAALTVAFRLTDADVGLQRYFYSPEKGWLLQYMPFWDFLYRFGIFPGYFLAFASLVLITLSYWNTRCIRYRKAAFVLVFTLVAGPGLLVNLVLKDHTGRPRPREITEFGGTEKFVCICRKGPSDDGKSFPCGHCSMGFYMAIPYLFLRRRKKILAYSVLALGTGYGLVIGIARMMAGGHFTSDVLWAGLIVWFTALCGFYLFRADEPAEAPLLSSADQKKKARRVTLLMGILLPVITAGLMLATPYVSSKEFHLTRAEFAAIAPGAVVFDLGDATVRIVPDTALRLEYKVNAFGFPNSKVRGHWSAGDTCRYFFEKMGWFTELKNMVILKIPCDGVPCNFLVRINRGRIIHDLPPEFSCRKVHLAPGTEYLLITRGRP